MTLARGELNPLSVLGLRKLSFIPNHFAQITVKIPEFNIKNLDQWINYHLNSRYAIKKTFILDNTNKMVEAITIGMEDPKEITMFSLSCPYIQKN
jgi:hypothetical protein